MGHLDTQGGVQAMVRKGEINKELAQIEEVIKCLD